MFRPLAFVLALALFPLSAGAQGTELRFGGVQQDLNAPVEVSADSLSIDQDNNQAVFSGNVVVSQGLLKLSADSVDVRYNTEGTGVDALTATGNVTLVSENDAAEADRADYDVTTGTLALTGNVLLTQGPTILSSERMVVNLEDGSARLEGRVRTTIPQGNN